MALKNIVAPIEVDVTQINKTWYSGHKRKHPSPQYVIAFYQRIKQSDNCRVKKLPDNKPETIEKFVRETISAPATIYCEQGILPLALKKDYTVEELNAVGGEHVRGDIHINNVKNVWKDLKRNIKREYISVSNEHLQGYCDEVSWHINNRNLSPGERFAKMIGATANGEHMTYRELTSRGPKKKSV